MGRGAGGLGTHVIGFNPENSTSLLKIRRRKFAAVVQVRVDTGPPRRFHAAIKKRQTLQVRGIRVLRAEGR